MYLSSFEFLKHMLSMFHSVERLRWFKICWRSWIARSWKAQNAWELADMTWMEDQAVLALCWEEELVMLWWTKGVMCGAPRTRWSIVCPRNIHDFMLVDGSKQKVLLSVLSDVQTSHMASCIIGKVIQFEMKGGRMAIPWDSTALITFVSNQGTDFGLHEAAGRPFARSSGLSIIAHIMYMWAESWYLRGFLSINHLDNASRCLKMKEWETWTPWSMRVWTSYS